MIIGIGCDIVDIQRIEKAMQKEGFLRILSEEEKSIFQTYAGKRKAEWIAGRFAAKEAIYKAISHHISCSFFEIEILRDDEGAPICNMDGCHIHISISHEAKYAIAYAIVETKE